MSRAAEEAPVELDEIERELQGARQDYDTLVAAIERQFLGHGDVVELFLLAILADGHVLLEGAPGLGKTTLVKGLAAALDTDFRRIQFTPDLMPADVIGTRILEEEAGERRFTFERGPVFCNVLLADEINRATPRTQSALLEAMQERQVTAFGTRYPLDDPFLVIATQNPIEMEGTYPLPEAQLDRFVFRVELSAPGVDELVAILEATTGDAPDDVGPVLDRDRVRRLKRLARGVPIRSDLVERVARTVLATHPDDERAPDPVRQYVRYGASPRGGQSILLTAKARALVHGRLHVADEDVEAVLAPALRHRLILGYEGEAAGVAPDELALAAWRATASSQG